VVQKIEIFCVPKSFSIIYFILSILLIRQSAVEGKSLLTRQKDVKNGLLKAFEEALTE